jgi:hypothetical protein
MAKYTRYAQQTKVPVIQTRSEIEKTLNKYGATGFAFAQEPNRAMIAFRLNKRHVRFTLTLPKNYTPQDERQRWRALLLVIKAKLEAVRAGIVEFDTEFLGQIIMPNGQTVADLIKDQIAAAYDSGQMPPLLIYRPPEE